MLLFLEDNKIGSPESNCSHVLLIGSPSVVRAHMNRKLHLPFPLPYSPQNHTPTGLIKPVTLQNYLAILCNTLHYFTARKNGIGIPRSLSDTKSNYR